MENTLNTTTRVKEMIGQFYSCMTHFIKIMDQENACIKEYDTVGLSQLLPLKKECCQQYEALAENLTDRMKQKELDKNDLLKLSHINKRFIEHTKKSYAYLENSHDYAQHIMNIFFKSLNETNPYSYSDMGKTKYVKSTTPIALSEKF